MGYYAVAARCVATPATADSIAAALWNPSSTARIWLVEASVSRHEAPANVSDVGLCRTSTRGTVGSTVTPDADNALDCSPGVAPASGAVLDMNHSAQPTLQKPHIRRQVNSDAIGHSCSWVFTGTGLCIPPGTGMAFYSATTTVFRGSHITFIWWEP